MADRSLNEDVGFWLRSVVSLQLAERAERALRENMVETVGDLLFLVSTRADLDALADSMGLGAGGVEPVWKGVVAARGGEASLTLETDAAAWMGARGHAEAELILREHLVETLGDLAFLAAGAEDLQALGFAPSVAADLSPILRQLEPEPEPEPKSPQPRAKRKAAVARAKVSPRPKKSSPRAAASQIRGTLDMKMDALAFLKTHGAGEMEAVLRENMVETLGDLLFLVNTRADLDAMGVGAAAANLWPILSAAVQSESADAVPVASLRRKGGATLGNAPPRPARGRPAMNKKPASPRAVDRKSPRPSDNHAATAPEPEPTAAAEQERERAQAAARRKAAAKAKQKRAEAAAAEEARKVAAAEQREAEIAKKKAAARRKAAAKAKEKRAANAAKAAAAAGRKEGEGKGAGAGSGRASIFRRRRRAPPAAGPEEQEQDEDKRGTAGENSGSGSCWVLEAAPAPTPSDAEGEGGLPLMEAHEDLGEFELEVDYGECSNSGVLDRDCSCATPTVGRCCQQVRSRRGGTVGRTSPCRHVPPRPAARASARSPRRATHGWAPRTIR
eukprot:COSAG04_NODE_5_length_50521_cov_24.772639_27_plen_561_part_00